MECNVSLSRLFINQKGYLICLYHDDYFLVIGLTEWQLTLAYIVI